MENGNYVITVGGLVAGLLVFVWWYYRRMVDKADRAEAEAQEKKDADIEARFKEVEEAGKACEKNFQEIRLQLAGMVTYEKMEIMQKDIKADMDKLAGKVDQVLLAFTRGRRKS